MRHALALFPLIVLAACSTLPQFPGQTSGSTKPVQSSLAPETVANGLADEPAKISDDFSTKKPAPNIPSTGSAKLSPLETTIWQLEDFNGSGIIDNSNITLRFDGAGRLAGRAGCNTYGGPYSYGKGALTIPNKLFSTKMACAPALMKQEQRFLTLLPQTTRAISNPATGALVLVTPQNHTLTFMPSGQ